jgi:predicted flap endonuclease-1-like 5' DNA nuclease
MSSVFSCWWWWLLLGGLLGWLLSWWLSRNAHKQAHSSWGSRFADIEGRHLATLRQKDTELSKLQGDFSQLKSRPLPAAEVKIVEKIVDRPVDRIVEKIVDRPVDRVVEKIVNVQVDNPMHLGRIRELEAEVGLIVGLRSQLSSLQAAPPKVIEKIVDRPVERVVEKIVDRPVDRVVEKIVDRPVDRIVEKVVNVQVDNPKHLGRIRELEAEVGLMIGLRSQISALQSAPPKVVEKIVDRPVDRIVERVVEKIVDRPVDRIVERIVDRPVDRIIERIVDRPVDRIVEKIVDRPVDRIVEKVVNVHVDNPKHLIRIRELETEIGVIAALRSQITSLQSAPPKVVDRIVDRPVDRIVEKIVERPVDRIVEKLVPDTRGLEERDRQIGELRLRIEGIERDRAATIALRDEEIRKLRAAQPAVLNKAAASAAGFNVRGMDDLEVVEGIGPKIAELLNADGIHYFSELALASTARIQGVLDRAGPNFRLARPDTWPQQAGLAAANRWAELRTLQDALNAGNRT